MSAEEPDTIAEARADVERTREELADTVEALAYKADVKARAKDKVDEVKAQAAEKAEEVKAQAAGKVEEVKVHAADKVAGRTGSSPEKVQAMAIAAGVVGLALLAIVWRRRAR